MMNTRVWRKLSVVATAPMNSKLRCKLFCIHPFHFRNAFSTKAHSQGLFSQFASSKLNMSETQIARILKVAPHLQKLRSIHEVEQFVNTLKKHGCTGVHIARIMTNRPSVIRLADEKVEPKIILMEDFGFTDRNLAKILILNPNVLGCNDILPKMEFLKDIFKCQDVLVKAMLRAPRLLCYSLEKTLKPSLAFWERCGLFEKGLLGFLKVCPVALICTSLTPAQMDIIQKIGIDKQSKMFKYIVGEVARKSPKTLESKIENLKHCGLSAEETLKVFGAVPLVLGYSEENVREKMSFITNSMELPANIVVKHVKLLQISLEKIMRPRFLIWQKIKSIDELDLPLLTLLSMSEARFLNNIIKRHPKSEILLEIYENAISDASNRSKSSAKTHLETQNS